MYASTIRVISWPKRPGCSMKSKKSAPITDVTKPKKTAESSAASKPQLVIPKRSIIVPVSSADSDGADGAPAKETLAPKPVGKSVEPKADGTAPASFGESKPKQPAGLAPTAPMPDGKQAPAAEPGAATAEPEPVPEPKTDSTAKSAGPGAEPHVRKALDDAKREQEIQSYIDNREFFVPINAVARKRSLKVSIALTFLELLLGLFLLNLMLDAGIIQLLEKIPHTHFFDIR